MTAAAELLEDHDSVTVDACCHQIDDKRAGCKPVRLTDEAPMISKRNRNNRSSSNAETAAVVAAIAEKAVHLTVIKSVLQMTAIVLLTIVVKRNLITTNSKANPLQDSLF